MSIATEQTRRRAIGAYKNGKGTQAEIARLYAVNIRTFQRWLERYNQTGEAAPQKRGSRKALFEGAALKQLDKLVQKYPDATLEELKVRSKTSGSIMAVKRALDRLGYRYKKNAPRQRTKSSGC